MSSEKVRPYAAVGNVRDLLRRYRHRNLPETVGPEVLRIAGVPEGMIGRTLAAFRFLGLLTEANEPTDEWRALSDVDDDSYPEMLGRIVRAAYADTFEHVDPSTDPQERIRSAFQPFQPKSQLDRMVTLFLALCAESGIPTRDTPKYRSTKTQQVDEAKTRKVNPSQNGKVVRNPLPPRDDSMRGQGGNSAVRGEMHPFVRGLVDSLPQPGTPWSDVERDEWLTAAKSIFALIYRPNRLALNPGNPDNGA